MSIEQIIKESINKNPLGMKEAIEEELKNRIRLALEASDEEMDDEDEDDDDEYKDMSEASAIVYKNKETGEIYFKEFDDDLQAQRAHQMYSKRNYVSGLKIGTPERMKLVAKGLKNKK